MPLTTGASLGAYQIIAAIGAGGMGEVYRARDTTLNRDVAIKVLPDLVAQDRDRLARFEREAQLLASPYHPNIAGLACLVSPARHRWFPVPLGPACRRRRTARRQALRGAPFSRRQRQHVRIELRQRDH